MYNIGIVHTRESNDDTYANHLSKITYRLYSLSREDVLNEASKMDALIIEDSSSSGLKHTCELILELRRRYEMLIWVVSKNLTKTSKIVYLQLGADGVVDAEHEQEESILQFSNILNRISREKGTVFPKEPYEKGTCSSELELNPTNLSVILEGKTEIGLTRLEFQTISFLLANVGIAVTYEEIYENVWKDDFNSNRDGNKQYRVSNLVFHLRKKIEENPNQPKYIKTVRSKGYMVSTVM